MNLHTELTRWLSCPKEPARTQVREFGNQWVPAKMIDEIVAHAPDSARSRQLCQLIRDNRQEAEQIVAAWLGMM